jgi:hypothetical protein
MFIEPNLSQTWNPFRALALTALWLTFVGLIAFALGGACGEDAPVPVQTTGAISLAWSIHDQNGRAASCADVGAQSVALRLRNRTTGGVLTPAAFPCEATPGTARVAPGVYDVAIELRAADGATLATANEQTGVTITAGQDRALTPVAFSASTQGSMVISIATPSATNCQALTANGAGITGTTVTLELAGGGCAPVTFARRLGTTPRGTYAVNCTSPVIAPCIEKTETLTTSLDPGSYVMRVRGKVGATDCWQRDDTLVVPPPGRPLVRTLGLVRVNLPGC